LHVQVIDAGAEVTLACEGVPNVLVALHVGGLKQHRSFSLAALQLLVKFGASMTDVDRLGKSALHVCAELNLHECAQWLLSNSGETTAAELLSVCDRDGFTPLHSAAFNGSFDVVVLLLEQLAKVTETKGGDSESPLINKQVSARVKHQNHRS
jgi:ankyrin repeat protein